VYTSRDKKHKEHVSDIQSGSVDDSLLDVLQSCEFLKVSFA